MRAPAILRAAVPCIALAAGCGRATGPDVPLSQVVASETSLKFTITLPDGAAREALQGRLLVLVSAAAAGEPRFQVNDGPQSAQVFGVDVESWMPGSRRTVDGAAFGYPVSGLAGLPPGNYRVQALLNRYRTYTRADGHTVSLPPDMGEGQQWARKPGNLYSLPIERRVDPAKDDVVELTLDQTIPPLDPPKDTPWVKHVRIKSTLLSKFWGTDVYLGAHVLLPAGYAEHPEVRYPLAVFHGHFTRDFDGWRTDPPDEKAPCVYNARYGVDCYNRVREEAAYALYKDWISPGFPRMLVVQIQHANPYYDASYAVNSANLGPYGDAITHELIPYIEKQFRGIGEGWARFLYGGSTGGWEAMAAQVFYPDQYNGAFVACPDPIDFRAYTVVNLYEDANAYWIDGPFRRTPRPGRRNYLGHVSGTLEQLNHLELALASRGRSGGQWDIWQAVYSPVGNDGYPRPIWDKRTGAIDRSVADYWKENYDLSWILRRDWSTLGPKLRGKLHIYVGDMDNYYLNNAVYLTEQFLKSATPPYAGVVDYGDRAEHCWNGDHERGIAYSQLRYVQMYVPRILERIKETAPPGADPSSWRY
ncbi:MAG TPA: alpha/beta hydrolase-fold protein [Vicinamibacterales bacterium]|nr:alpha/beta hydrolase-fold protein [Vicinamibacterales bacterium]